MQIFSFPKCQTCLVKMCCQNVCEEYREHIFKTRGCEVLIDTLSLKECEEAIGSNMEREGPIELKVGDNQIRVSINLRGIV
jgi:hypothetical protein